MKKPQNTQTAPRSSQSQTERITRSHLNSIGRNHLVDDFALGLHVPPFERHPFPRFFRGDDGERNGHLFHPGGNRSLGRKLMAKPFEHQYNEKSVDDAIDSAYRRSAKGPSKKQRKVIHSLLKGNRK